MAVSIMAASLSGKILAQLGHSLGFQKAGAVTKAPTQVLYCACDPRELGEMGEPGREGSRPVRTCVTSVATA